MKAKRFFLYNLIAFVFALQVVIITNYWFFIYNNAVYSAVNDTIPYNGQIYDSGNNGLNGEYKMRMLVYNALSGGTLLWTEKWDGTDQNTTLGGVQGDTVTITQGVFQVDLNSLCGSWTGNCASNGGVTFNEGTVYLQVELDVDGNGAFEEIFTPRKRFSSAAYANNSDNLDGASVGTTGATIPILNANSFFGNLQTFISSALTTSSVYVIAQQSQSANLVEVTDSADTVKTSVNENATIKSDKIEINKLFYNNVSSSTPSLNDDAIVGYWKYDTATNPEEPANSATAAVDSYRALWLFDEGTSVTTRDKTANANTCTLTNSTGGTLPTWVSEKNIVQGNLLRFNRSSKVTCGSAASIRPTGAFSVEMLFKPNAINQYGYPVLMANNDYVLSSNQNGWLIILNYFGGGFKFQITDGSSGAPLVSLPLSTMQIAPGQWTHLVAVFDPANDLLKVYTNGILRGQTSTAINTIDYNSGFSYVLTMGHASDPSVPNDNLFAFDGDIAYSAMYTSALTGSQVITLAENAEAYASDLTGNNHSTTYNNSAMPSATGAFGYTEDSALTLDGTDDYVSVADHDKLSFGNGTDDQPFSIEGWAKLSTVATDGGLVTKWSGSGALREYALWSDNGQITFNQYDESTDAQIGRKVSTAISTNAWHHIVATSDGSQTEGGLAIYIDGTRADNTSTSSGSYVAMENLAQGFEMGRYVDTGSTFYSTGSLDNIVMYSRQLSATEITKHYQESLGSAGISIDTTTALNNPDNELLSIHNNATQVASFGVDGGLTAKGLTLTSNLLETLGVNVSAFKISGVENQSAKLTEYYDPNVELTGYVDAQGDAYNRKIYANDDTTYKYNYSNQYAQSTPPSTSSTGMVTTLRFDDNKIPPPTTDTGVAHYYKFDENTGSTTTPIVGSYTATHTNTAWTTSCYFLYSTDACLDYNGTTASTSYGTLGNIHNTISVFGWVYFDTVTGEKSLFGRAKNVSGTDTYENYLSANGANLKFKETNAAGSTSGVTGSNTFSTGTWYFVGFTRNASNLVTLYVNGASVGSATITSDYSLTGENYYSGMSGLSTLYHDGKIDNMVVYSTVLDATDVNRLYAKSLSTQVADDKGANHGTVNSATFIGTSNGAFGYTGDDAMVFTTGVTTPNVSLGDFSACEGLTTATMMGWAKKDSVAVGGTLFRKTFSSTSSYGAYFSNVSGMKFVVEVRNGAASYATWDFAGVITNNEWFHWVMMYNASGATDADKLKLYVNGVQRTLTFVSTIGATTPSNTATFLIGNDASAAGWGGAIDGFTFFNTTLTDNAITTFYNNQKDGGRAHVYDTQNNFTSGSAKLLSLKNYAVEKLSVGLSFLKYTGDADKELVVDRPTVGSTPGYDLTLSSGSAVLAGTNLAAGTVTLSSGISTGTGSSSILLKTSGGGSTGTSDSTPSTKLTISGDGSVRVADNSELRFYDGSYYVGFTSPTLSGNKIWTLPSVDGAAKQVLKTDGSGVLSWRVRNLLSRVAVTSGSYSIGSTDTLIGVNYAGAVALTLPAPTSGRTVIIKDESGAANTNNITINPNGSELIEGAATATITANYGKINLISDGTNWFSY